MTGPKKPGDSPKSLLNKLEKYKEEKSIVEILTDAREITGVLSSVGTDYLGIVSSIERTVKNTAVGQDGVEESTENLIVTELEVLLKLEDIRAISKVLKAVAR